MKIGSISELCISPPNDASGVQTKYAQFFVPVHQPLQLPAKLEVIAKERPGQIRKAQRLSTIKAN